MNAIHALKALLGATHHPPSAPRSSQRTGRIPSLFGPIVLGLFCMASVIDGIRVANAANDSSSFTLFESGQVRPLAISPDGKRLFAVNTPDGRLEVFQVIGSGLKHRFSVQVGLEPVAVAARTDDEVWVVNHLSDSVSVVDVGDASHARVMRTLLVGDEPRDIVFAGPGKSRAFITTAHRGQNTPRDPQLTTPGVGRADVWVFDAENLGDTLEDVPLTVITLFTDTPRALAVTPDGGRVYAAGFHTGNKTTTINEFLVRQGISPPFKRIYPEPLLDQGPVPQPLVNHAGIDQPSVGLIVQFKGGHWVDNIGQVWDDMVPLSPVTTAFLTWVGALLKADGKKALLLVWDNASWHLSKEVRSWVRAPNRWAKREGGVRILICQLPVKSPWLNRIEPKWVHAKRAVAEPARLLSKAELIGRICSYFTCKYVEHLKQAIAKKIA